MKFINLDQVMDKTAMSRTYIMTGKAGFPAGRKIEGRRELVWIDTEIEAWMELQIQKADAA